MNRKRVSRIIRITGLSLLVLGAGYPMGYFPKESWYWTYYHGLILIMVNMSLRESERKKTKNK